MTKELKTFDLDFCRRLEAHLETSARAWQEIARHAVLADMVKHAEDLAQDAASLAEDLGAAMMQGDLPERDD